MQLYAVYEHCREGSENDYVRACFEAGKKGMGFT